jgi:hypothetical protein
MGVEKDGGARRQIISAGGECDGDGKGRESDGTG